MVVLLLGGDLATWVQPYGDIEDDNLTPLRKKSVVNWDGFVGTKNREFVSAVEEWGERGHGTNPDPSCDYERKLVTMETLEHWQRVDIPGRGIEKTILLGETYSDIGDEFLSLPGKTRLVN